MEQIRKMISFRRRMFLKYITNYKIPKNVQVFEILKIDILISYVINRKEMEQKEKKKKVVDNIFAHGVLLHIMNSEE